MSRKRKPIRIYEAKLGQWHAAGLSCREGSHSLVVIDPRLKSRSYLNTLIHEVLHTVEPNRGESWIIRSACRITRAVWEAGYRKIAK